MDPQTIIVSAFAILFAITVHEAAHAWMAARLGDRTAADRGRVSLNPLVHIDLVGTILLPAMLIIGSGGRGPVFGWAKPVPFNPHNLRHPRKGGLWISLAGPSANVLTALLSAMFFRVLRLAMAGLPAGSALIGPAGIVHTILEAMVLINLTLAFFNLIPVPPLDGSGILAGLLTGRAAAAFERVRPFGFFILLGLMLTRALNIIYVPVAILHRALLY